MHLPKLYIIITFLPHREQSPCPLQNSVGQCGSGELFDVWCEYDTPGMQKSTNATKLWKVAHDFLNIIIAVFSPLDAHVYQFI